MDLVTPRDAGSEGSQRRPSARSVAPRRLLVPLASARFAILLLAISFLAIPLLGVFTRPGFAQNPAEDAFRRGQERFEAASRLRRSDPTRRAEIEAAFHEAGVAFVEAWRNGASSANVLTNAANSFVFAAEKGEAMLHYLRALAIDPSNEVALAGLAALRSELPIRTPSRGGTASLTSALFFWHTDRSLHTRWWVFVIVFPLAWVFFASELVCRRRSSMIGPFATLGWIALVVSVPVGLSLVHDLSTRDPADRAVVLVEVVGRNGDGEHYSPSHTRGGKPAPFPAGTELRILETRAGSGGDWLAGELLDGSRTWIPARVAERVIPKS